MPRLGRPKGLPKTGGRQKGTPNKRTQLELEAAQKLGGNVLDLWTTVLSKSPVELSEYLGLTAKDVGTIVGVFKIQIDTAKDAAPYLLSKMPQRIAVGGDEELGPVTVGNLSPDEARKLVLERLGKAAL